jgi:hypothetical protein
MDTVMVPVWGCGGCVTVSDELPPPQAETRNRETAVKTKDVRRVIIWRLIVIGLLDGKRIVASMTWTQYEEFRVF